jgi:hypothetical protein
MFGGKYLLGKHTVSVGIVYPTTSGGQIPIPGIAQQSQQFSQIRLLRKKSRMRTSWAGCQ